MSTSTTKGHNTPGQLAGKVAIVTGASRGVGAELARVYAREGASVVVNYFRSAEKAESVVQSIRDVGGTAMAQYGDVTSPEDMKALTKATIEAYGRIDILVNNALANYQFDATSSKTRISTVEWENFDQQFTGTVRGAVNAVKAVLPQMEENNYGKIVNIGTVSVGISALCH
jgi:3-oxoacyl-[acyl-carrier protein] reductase